MRQRIYVTRAIPRPAIEALEAEHDVVVNGEDRALAPDELRRNVAGCAAIVSLLTDRIDGPLLDAAGSGCRIVANYAVGTNNFDVPAATERGVALTNTPGVLDDATATHTIALMLAMARRIPEAERFLREGRWDGWKPMFFIGADVDRKVLGIAGAGRIGRNVARKARGFDMEIIYSDVEPNRAIEDETGARFVGKARAAPAGNEALYRRRRAAADEVERHSDQCEPWAGYRRESPRRGATRESHLGCGARRVRGRAGARSRPGRSAERRHRPAYRLGDGGDQVADGGDRSAQRARGSVRRAAPFLHQSGGARPPNRSASGFVSVGQATTALYCIITRIRPLVHLELK
jgi:hypothetical protein